MLLAFLIILCSSLAMKMLLQVQHHTNQWMPPGPGAARVTLYQLDASPLSLLCVEMT